MEIVEYHRPKQFRMKISHQRKTNERIKYLRQKTFCQEIEKKTEFYNIRNTCWTMSKYFHDESTTSISDVCFIL